MNIIATIRALLGLVPTTEKAISSLVKAAERLEAVAFHEADLIDAHSAKIVKLKDAINQTEQARKEASARADRANRVAANVNALIG